MITDPIVLEVLDRSSAPASVVRGFSYGSPSHYLRPRQNSPLWCSSTARGGADGANPKMVCSSVGFRISLTLSHGGS